MLCDLFLDRRRIGQKILVLNSDELWVSGGCAFWRSTAGKDDPRRKRTTSQVGDLTDAVVCEKTTQDS